MMKCPTWGLIAIALSLVVAACGSDGGTSGGNDGNNDDSVIPELPGLTQEFTLMREYPQRPKVEAFGNSFGVLVGNKLQIIRAASGEVAAEHEIPADDANIKAMVDSQNLIVQSSERQPGTELRRGETETVTRVFGESGEKIWEGVDDWKPVGSWLTRSTADDGSTGATLRGLDVRSLGGEKLSQAMPPKGESLGYNSLYPLAGAGSMLIARDESNSDILAYSAKQGSKSWSAREANSGAYYLENDPKYVGIIEGNVLIEWHSGSSDVRSVFVLHASKNGEQMWDTKERLGETEYLSEKFDTIEYETTTNSKVARFAVYSNNSNITRVLNTKGAVVWQLKGGEDGRSNLWPSFISGRYLYGIRTSEWDHNSGEAPSGNPVVIDTEASKVVWNDNAVIPEDMTGDGYVWLSTAGSQNQPFAGAIVKVG